MSRRSALSLNEMSKCDWSWITVHDGGYSTLGLSRGMGWDGKRGEWEGEGGGGSWWMIRSAPMWCNVGVSTLLLLVPVLGSHRKGYLE